MGGWGRSISCSSIVKWQRNMLNFHVNIWHLAFSYWEEDEDDYDYDGGDDNNDNDNVL
jgi:hypothetical protein